MEDDLPDRTLELGQKQSVFREIAALEKKITTPVLESTIVGWEQVAKDMVYYYRKLQEARCKNET